MKLLILGPDPDTRTAIAQKLEADGVEIKAAPIGSSAGAVLSEAPWNVLLLAADRPDGEIPPLDEIERRHIELVLKETDFNMSRAARILQIDRTTLYNKLRKYGFKRNLAATASVDS